ncbi:MAG: YraN family protein [Clostridia bacterium]|nr:YraN family protein [Clostridia bacterium]
MYFRKEIGKWGENLACQYLQRENYKIIERNFLCNQGEIDIIAKDMNKKELVFFEVKTRSNFKYGNPADAIDINKQKHMKKAIKYYLYKKQLENIPIRVDVVEVYIVEDCKINHIKQVF